MNVARILFVLIFLFPIAHAGFLFPNHKKGIEITPT
jgi:hypothetical protein